MVKFDIIVAEDSKVQREALVRNGLGDLLKDSMNLVTPNNPPNPDKHNVIAVANPAQLALWLEENRGKAARNLLVLSDGNMEEPRYNQTSTSEPGAAQLQQYDDTFDEIFDLLRGYANEAGINVVYALRSSSIFVDHKGSLGQQAKIEDININQYPRNNFHSPIKIAKGIPTREEVPLLKAILDHCDKLFAIQATPAQ